MTFDSPSSAIGGHARVVLHADDLGLNRAVTDGILRGFEQGLLTSTALLANAPDAARAAGLWKGLVERFAAGELPSAPARRALGDPPRPFDLGIHLNLTQGRPLTGAAYPAELLDAEGRFPGPGRLLVQLCRHRRRVRAGLNAELVRQIEFLLDHGLRPTHLNGHQYVEMMPVVDEMIPELLDRFGIRVLRVAREPRLWRSTLVARRSWRAWISGEIKQAFARRFARRMAEQPAASPTAFFGTAHAGSIDLELIRAFLAGLRPSALVEIGLHPGEPAEARAGNLAADGIQDPLADRRPAELALLVSAELRQYLAEQGYRLGRLTDLGID